MNYTHFDGLPRSARNIIDYMLLPQSGSGPGTDTSKRMWCA